MARPQGWPALFWTAFKGSRNAMVFLDERRHHVEVNGAYLKLLGFARGELIGRPAYDLVAGGPLLTRAMLSRRASGSSCAWSRPTRAIATSLPDPAGRDRAHVLRRP